MRFDTNIHNTDGDGIVLLCKDLSYLKRQHGFLPQRQRIHYEPDDAKRIQKQKAHKSAYHLIHFLLHHHTASRDILRSD